MKLYQKVVKRVIDILIASIGFVVLFPLFLIIALLLLISNRDNPFFFQSRPGKNGKIFKVVKFKTMNNKRDEGSNLLQDHLRLTTFGRFLRSTSLDEIPQLLNVIKGDMSLIGPRPLLVEYLPRYNEFQKRRHEVRPGISGWAQVNGRNAISWQEKFKLDVWYVDHVSYLTDMKIFWMTILKVVKKEGVNQSDTATMEKFNGKN